MWSGHLSWPGVTPGSSQAGPSERGQSVARAGRDRQGVERAERPAPVGERIGGGPPDARHPLDSSRAPRSPSRRRVPEGSMHPLGRHDTGSRNDPPRAAPARRPSPLRRPIWPSPERFPDLRGRNRASAERRRQSARTKGWALRGGLLARAVCGKIGTTRPACLGQLARDSRDLLDRPLIPLGRVAYTGNLVVPRLVVPRMTESERPATPQPPLHRDCESCLTGHDGWQHGAEPSRFRGRLEVGGAQ